MIETEGLARRFGRVFALHPLTLTLPAGRVVGLLGSNGAGKTTTLNILATLLPPSDGTARVAGFDVRKQPLDVRRVIGLVPEHAAVYEGLTADEYLELAARVRGLPDATWRGRAERFLAHLELQDARTRRLGTFSKGMRAKVLLAAALLHDPQVLILDEPMSGLDVPSQQRLVRLLAEFAASGRTVLYSSHVLEQVERACDVLVLLHQGNLLWCGDVADLRARHEGASLPEIFLRMTHAEAGASLTWAQLLAGP